MEQYFDPGGISALVALVSLFQGKRRWINRSTHPEADLTRSSPLARFNGVSL